MCIVSDLITQDLKDFDDGYLTRRPILYRKKCKIFNIQYSFCPFLPFLMNARIVSVFASKALHSHRLAEILWTFPRLYT